MVRVLTPEELADRRSRLDPTGFESTLAAFGLQRRSVIDTWEKRSSQRVVAFRFDAWIDGVWQRDGRWVARNVSDLCQSKTIAQRLSKSTFRCRFFAVSDGHWILNPSRGHWACVAIEVVLY